MSKNWETREQIRSKDSRGPQIAYTQNDAFQAGMETQNCIETIETIDPTKTNVESNQHSISCIPMSSE